MIDCMKAGIFPENGSMAAKLSWIETHGVESLLLSSPEGVELSERIHVELGAALRRITLPAAMDLARLIGIKARSCRDGEFHAAVTSLEMVLANHLGGVFQEEL